MTTWARSDAYGSSVVLGPTQEAVYRFVLGATDNGIRPEFTLGHIARVTGKPVSSVHDALGRLRALGLIGYVARMGRTGGVRLWRVVRRGALAALDPARHKLAVARVIKRWYPRPSVVSATQGLGGQLVTPWPDGMGGQRTVLGASSPIDVGPSFRDRMTGAGFRPWWRERATVRVPLVQAGKLATED